IQAEDMPEPDGNLLQEQCLQQAKPCFNPICFVALARASLLLPGMGNVLPATIGRFLSSNPGDPASFLDLPPNSVSDFLAKTSTIFSPAYVDHLRGKF